MEILEWTLLSYPLSLSKIREWDFAFIGDAGKGKGISVASFWKCLHDHGRHKYLMTRGLEGGGERFWM